MMTKDIILSITGLQYQVGADENDIETTPVEVVTPATYYEKNGKHYVLFEEAEEGTKDVTRSTIKINREVVEVMKKGTANVHMIFERNKKNLTYYSTPFGNLLVGITAQKVNVKESEDNIDVEVDYSLDVNYEFLADCTINMNLKSKKAKDFTLYQS